MLEPYLKAAKAAQGQLQATSLKLVNWTLEQLALALEHGADRILEANQQDVAAIDPNDPTVDRLRLDDDRITAMASGLRAIALMPDPVGRLLTNETRPNGLVIQRVTVPFGTIGLIYEARPSVTIDVFGLALKSRNVVILKGGSEAQRTNELLVGLIQSVLNEGGLPTASCTLLPADRSLTAELVVARSFIDLLVPRGSQQLIDWTREHARVPMIETGAGVCHTYVDKSANIKMAGQIITNAKTHRPSVCNALDTLLVHASLIPKIDFLTYGLLGNRVEIRADERVREAITYDNDLLRPASEADFGTEFLSLRLAIKTVDSLDEAIDHIATHGSKHSEAIITEDTANAERFLRDVDAAAVYVNGSTALTDGGEFGLGGELGISTQKLHARGPMGLEALTTYKWLVRGTGQTRP